MRFIEPTPEQEADYTTWVASRPAAVRAVAERFEPWSLYRLTTSGHRVRIVSLQEQVDGRVTLTVAVSGQWNAVMFDRHVFGIAPDDLEPCELPEPGESLGTLLRSEDVDANVELLRAMALQKNARVRQLAEMAFREGFRAGFGASCEGFNGEYAEEGRVAQYEEAAVRAQDFIWTKETP